MSGNFGNIGDRREMRQCTDEALAKRLADPAAADESDRKVREENKKNEMAFNAILEKERQDAIQKFPEFGEWAEIAEFYSAYGTPREKLAAAVEAAKKEADTPWEWFVNQFE